MPASSFHTGPKPAKAGKTTKRVRVAASAEADQSQPKPKRNRQAEVQGDALSDRDDIEAGQDVPDSSQREQEEEIVRLAKSMIQAVSSAPTLPDRLARQI